MRSLTLRLCTALLLAAASGCQSRPAADFQAAASDPALLHTAVERVTDAMMESVTSPPVSSRTYAYSSIAAYEASRHGRPEYRTLAGQLEGLQAVPEPEAGQEYLLPLAGLNAYLTVAEALVFAPEKVAEHREALIEQLRERGVPRALLNRSMEYGATVGRHVLAWAGTDGLKEARASARLEIRPEPGRWMPTPPAYMDAVEPNWKMVRTFALDSASQFVPPPPHPYDPREGSPFHRELMEVYEVGRNLTPEQREIAAFWDCNPFALRAQGHIMAADKKISPGGHWMGITGHALRLKKADFVRSAEAYARVAMALHDGFVSAWDEKYRSVRVRPVTAIQAEVDPRWQPLLQTPPFPEYPSGHSVISGAAAEVLTELFGDNFAFDDSVEVRFGLPVRSFTSFRQAAQEAAMSRLYGGIHYRDGVVNGLTQGRSVGEVHVARVQTRAPAMARAGR